MNIEHVTVLVLHCDGCGKPYGQDEDSRIVFHFRDQVEIDFCFPPTADWSKGFGWSRSGERIVCGACR